MGREGEGRGRGREGGFMPAGELALVVTMLENALMSMKHVLNP